MASRESGLLFSLERGLRIAVWVRQEKKALTSRGWGLLRGFLELRRPWGFFTRQDEDLREPLVRCQGSQVSVRVARGSGLILSWYSENVHRWKGEEKKAGREERRNGGRGEGQLTPCDFPQRPSLAGWVGGSAS